MSLSEAEAEARLAALRRQREAIDRAIADLVLYLELGRRLNAGGQEGRAGAVSPAPDPGAGPADVRGSDPAPQTWNPGHAPEQAAAPAQVPVQVPWPPAGLEAPAAPMPHPLFQDRHQERPAAGGGPTRPARKPHAPAPVAFAEDPTGARQYGRALIEAACAILDEAGGPLHARDIHDALIARGFAIPGRDPVAALNTRLWKRSGEGGPLRRHGDAVYGLAEG